MADLPTPRVDAFFDRLLSDTYRAKAENKNEGDFVCEVIKRAHEEMQKLERELAAAEQRAKAAEEALNKAAYALFQIKRMGSSYIPGFASNAHEEACKVLNGDAARRKDAA